MVLKKVATYGLHGNHHFYVSYDTNHVGVEMAESLRRQYPDEITIVIQHNFKDLQVFDEYFQISLSFGGKHTKLVIPFKAITSFADPSEMFELEFNEEIDRNDDFYFSNMSHSDTLISLKDTKTKSSKDSAQNNVICLDNFRKSKATRVSPSS
jgi:hypothetical protein